MDKSIKYLNKYKKLMKEFGWQVIHLKSKSPKKLKEVIDVLKKGFMFQDTIFILRSKTTSRRLIR